jgi:DNA polymerase
MHSVVLARETDWDGWRAATRALVLGGVPPEDIVWSAGEATALFANGPRPPEAAGTFNVPRALVELAGTVILARESERFALLYRLVWRAHHGGERQLLEQVTDPEVRRAQRLAQAVLRDCHKMRAFLRFRAVEEPDGIRYVGWFEPDHYILEANAPFFVRRFATMSWSILTPEASAHWDGETLRLGPGADPREVPDDDTLEAYWRAYFAAIFNPARLKVGAMLSEMPKKYWRNLPEAAAIPDLIRSASGRTEQMLEQDLRPPEKLPLGPVRLRSRQSGPAARSSPLARAAHDAETCRRCDLWQPATQTVFGEGPADARVMFVGEQPGDQEDVAGRPFVGPAGQLLDRALEEAGIDRRTVYVTNAVKHFKFVPRGKRRIHQKPEGPEIAACKFWLDIELREVQPDLLVLLGATAARAALGRTVTIGRERGRRIELPDGQAAFVTVHPSFLLRVPDEDSRAREYRAFLDDLRKAAQLAAEIAGERDAG